MNVKQIFKFLIAIGISSLILLVEFETLSKGGQYTLFIFILAAILWTTEIVPLYMTSFVVLFLESILLPGIVPGLSKPTVFFSQFFSPVIVLFLGGFAIAKGLGKFRLDAILACNTLRIVKGKPKTLMFAFMVLAAFLSMWMSNTATTALMITMVMPVLKSVEDKKYQIAVAIAIAFSANIGGMATPVGTPPNAIAIGMLADKGVSISFYEWMKIAFPITAIMLLVTFAVLLLLFRFKIHNIEESPKLNISCIKFGLNEKIVVSITLLTIVLWFISEFIGLNAGIIALIPLICFYGTNILDKDDFRTLDWDVLMLMGGGMALSEAMKISGLAEWMVTTSGVAHFNDTYILLGFMILTFVLTNFMSNTTTAALMLPLALSVIKDPLIAGYTVALTASMSMLLPISTPPNAIAYNSGFFSVKTMLFAGTIIGMIGMAIIFNYLLMM